MPPRTVTLCVRVSVLLSLKTGCFNMNPLDFSGSIREMRLWLTKMALVMEAERARDRGTK